MSQLLEARRPVVFFANGIGDTFLNLPALRALSSLFAVKPTLICNPGAYRLCFSELSIRSVVEARLWDDNGVRQFDAEELAAEIEGCDLFISLVPWYSEALKAFLQYLSPKVSVGFFPQFDIALPRDYRKHSADLAFDVPKFFAPSLRLEDFAARPKFPSQAQEEAHRIRAQVPATSRLLVIHTDTLPGKMWPVERFVSVLDLFLDRHPDFLVLAVGGVHQSLETGDNAERIILTYGLPLAVSCCLVAHATLFLGVDSCMLHVADFCRVPGVGLFGPTSSTEFGFRLSRHRHVCGFGSMSTISIPSVTEALDSLLAEGTECPASNCIDSFPSFPD